MNEEIVLFLQRLEYAKQTLISLLEFGGNLDKLGKIDKIIFGDSGIMLTREFDPDYFEKLIYVVIDVEKRKFEESKLKVMDILDGKLDDEIRKSLGLDPGTKIEEKQA